MTMKLILGVFLALVLLLPSQLLAGEKPSPGPTMAKLGTVPSDCGCLKKDKAPTSLGLRPDILTDKPSRAPAWYGCPPPCTRVCRWLYFHDQGWVWRCVCECRFFK